MRFPIDVAYLDAEGVVIKTVQMRRHRLAAPVTHARIVIEAEAGAFARWGLRVGDQLEVRTDESDDDESDNGDDGPADAAAEIDR